MKKRILLLSKDPTISLALSEMLRGEDFRLECVPRQDQAMAVVEKFEPDLILWELLECQDYAFVVGLRSHPKLYRLPVICLSSCNTWMDRVEALRFGIDVLVGTPFCAEELMAEIFALLAQAKRLRSHSMASGSKLVQFPIAALLLTQNEQKVLSYVSRGEHNKCIARVLNLSQRTIEAHITSMLNKTGFNNRTQLARWHLEMSNQVATEQA